MTESIFNFFLGFQGPGVYFLIFSCLLICGLGLPLPEDITLIGAGLLAYYEQANVHGMVAISLLGVAVGDSFVFLLGQRYGNDIRQKAPFNKVFTELRYRKSKRLIKKKGNKLIFAARFMPGLRAPIFFTAGTLKLPYRVFIFYDGLAAIISVPAIIYAVWYFGSELEKVIHIIKRVEYAIVIIIILLVALFFMRYRQRKNLAREKEYLAREKAN